MKLEELDIWGANPPEPWVRAAADRWAALVERVAHFFNDLFASSPLPQTETEILALIWKEPDAAEPAILANHLRVSRQSMTGLLDKLESGRYVARANHPTDRRRTIVRLKPKGRAVIREFAAGVLCREAALFGTQSEGEVSSALDTLDHHLSILEQWHAEHPLDKANSWK